MFDKLVDDIYEAALVSDAWPRVFESLGSQFGSQGGVLFARSDDGVRWTGGGAVTAAMRDFLAAGWMKHNERPALAMAKRHPGFLNELDYMSDEATHELPIFSEFLRPRGYFATAGTHVQGLTGDDLFFSLEGFDSHDAARAAIPELDQLRPHLARAVQLAGQFRLERMKGHVDAMDALGTAACVLGSQGTPRVTNDRFQRLLGSLFLDFRSRLYLADARADALMARTLAQIGAGQSTGRSIVLRDGAKRARVLHVLPVRGRANDVFVDGAAMLVLSHPDEAVDALPEIVRELFDLTPAEAKVAGLVSRGGARLQQIADELGVSLNTVKTQLKAVFEKTGTSRQIDLARLLLAATLPRT